MLNKVKIFLISLLTFFMVNAIALTDSGFYQATVGVDSTSNNARVQVLPQALAQVLLKVVPGFDSEDIISLIKNENLDSFIARYNHKKIPGDDNLYLTIQFDPETVQKFLKKNELTSWKGKRPTATVWLAYAKEKVNLEILSEQDEDRLNLKSRFSEFANERGLFFMFPIGDLKDRENINYLDIVTQDHGAVKRASKRYIADTIISGYLQTKEDESYQINWSIIYGEDVYTFTQSGYDIDEVIKKSIMLFSSTLARQFTAGKTAASKKDLIITVDGVKTLKSYTEVLRILADTAGIDNLNLINIIADRLILRANNSGNSYQLSQNLNLQGSLHVINTSQNDKFENSSLITLRYNP